MYLFILNGPRDGYRFTVAPGTHSIGRSPDASVSIPEDQFISGQHAELQLEAGGKMILTDRGSRNGTFLLGEPVVEPKDVKPGDIFQVGKTFIKVSRRAIERYIISESESENTPETILVLDMVGSSRIAQAMGDRVASKVKDILNAKLQEKLKKFPAEFMKSTGDGFMIIFSNVKSAIRFALEYFEDLKADEYSRGIHIRIGIHYGETTKLPDGDRRGMAVDMAFRVEGVRIDDMHQTVVGIKKDMLPRMDRIFISEVVQRMIGNDSQIKTRCIGYFDLKGFTGRHKIFEIMV